LEQKRKRENFPLGVSGACSPNYYGDQAQSWPNSAMQCGGVRA
jgi:hypothetical protein